MEAITAVGLATNVLQFFEFTTRLIRVSNELRNNATSSENKDYQVIATHLEGLAQSIKDSAQAISQASATSSSEEKLIDKGLEPVVDSCCELAKDLLGRLKKCGIQPGQNASRFQRAKVAFKAIWSKKEIEEILNRLQLLKSEINLHYIVQIKKTQLDQQVRQPTIDDIQAIGRQIDSLRPLVGNLRGSIDSNAESQHPQIMNSQVLSRAARQALASRIGLSGQLDNSQSSMTTMNTSLENMQSRQSETYESIARVRIQNSTFFTRATQQVPLSSDSGASFHNVIRPLFEEYFEKALTEMKKEYRTAARSQADHLLKDLLPTLHEMQSGCVVAQGSYLGVADEDIPEVYRERSELQDHPIGIQNAEPLARRQLGKNDRVFDEIIQQRIGFDRSADTVDIPVAMAASKVVARLREARGELLFGNGASSILSVPYRGHYAAPDVAKSLEFLEYVMSMGISSRPDSIFDTFSDTRISDMFRNGSWEHIWAEILEEHGFNADWVYKENERRKRVGAGDTSAHEVSVRIDASAVRDVRRRRGYDNSSE
ncbi:hypothetical protein Hte_006830 [Hypoxylon texense]